MVYFGPSRGCETCKRRRKKCDETRPSCMRCTTARRTCGGYEDSNNFIMRQYDSQSGLVPFRSIARKCSLPVRERPGSAGSSISSDVPKEVSEEASDRLALSAFFYDYCVVSTNPALSRGFLSGLEETLHRQGFDSDLARACKLVAFANHGITLNRPTLSHRAEAMYSDLVATLATLIQNSTSSAAANEEAMLIAMLLGLYEIIVADGLRPGIHNIHAGGIAAMLRIKNNPLRLLEVIQHDKPFILHPKFQRIEHGLFAGPDSKTTAYTLDSLIIQLEHVWQRGKELLSTSPISPTLAAELRREALSLDQMLIGWGDAQENGFKPSSIGRVDEKTFSFEYDVAHWPGKVDTYFDPYVAAVWNIYRVARLLLIEFIFKLSDTLSDDADHDAEHDNILHLLEDLLASIPYHLVEDLHVFYRDLGNDKSAVNPGRAVSGLLLMQPLHIVSNLSIVNPWIRKYLNDCLKWIGQHMGIKQAALLAECLSFDLEYLSGGSMITLVGLLV